MHGQGIEAVYIDAPNYPLPASRIADGKCAIHAIQKFVRMRCTTLNGGVRKAGNGHLDQDLMIKHHLGKPRLNKALLAIYQ